MHARSIVYVFIALATASCFNDDTQPLTIEVQNMSQRVTSVLVDDQIGIACMKHSVTEQNGHNPQTITYTGGCMAASDIPGLAGGSLREPFDVTEYADDIIIDDDNAIVCLKLSSQFKGCVEQSKLNQNGLATLRSFAH